MDWRWRLLKDYNQDDFLSLSGIQHFLFCKRQWALIHIEKQWVEDYRTAEGRLLHETAHDITKKEKRKDTIISRAMPIHSYQMGINGECDVVEFKQSDTGIWIPMLQNSFTLTPIEYKRGKPKEGLEDILQLVAQAMCLDEMFCCSVETSYLFYHEIKKRLEIPVTPELKSQVRETFQEMHSLLEKQHTPKVKWSTRCNGCSLKDICLPTLGKQKSAHRYIEKAIQGGKL